jgi:hypothetical protein
VLSVEQYLATATMSLPAPVATSMRAALTQSVYRIRAGRYDDGGALCPLGAADAFAGEQATDEWGSDAVSSEGYGGRIMRFAISFDLCAAHTGLDAASRS